MHIMYELFFCIGKPAQLYDCNNPDWVPSLKLGYERSQAPDQERYTRLQVRNKRRKVSTVDCTTTVEDEDTETGVACQTDTVDSIDVACQTDVDAFELARMHAELQQLREDNQCLRTETSKAKQQVERASFSVESLKNDEQKLKFYTGKS